jgi:hypothetical protein
MPVTTRLSAVVAIAVAVVATPTVASSPRSPAVGIEGAVEHHGALVHGLTEWIGVEGAAEHAALRDAVRRLRGR